AILSCMAYIDLNPIRAGKARTPEESEFTGAYQRIKAAKVTTRQKASGRPSIWLPPIEEIFQRNGKATLTLSEYLLVLDRTGRQLARGKKGAIPKELRPILERVSIQPDNWLQSSGRFRRMFPRVAGKVEAMRQAAECCGRQWFKGVTAAARCF
ncbi:MAG: hypothetical protein KDD69_01345, partial [Bdellovibrionales bacterium]|nr:hypothetical protein [Bdellovibrionales bacterium]